MTPAAISWLDLAGQLGLLPQLRDLMVAFGSGRISEDEYLDELRSIVEPMLVHRLIALGEASSRLYGGEPNRDVDVPEVLIDRVARDLDSELRGRLVLDPGVPDEWAARITEFNPYHDERGKFATAPGGRVPLAGQKWLARQAADAVARGEGISINAWGYRPKTGYMVGGALPEYVVELPKKRVRPFVLQKTTEFVKKHRAEIIRRQLHIGGWIEDGKLYLDGSNRRSLRHEAILMGDDRKQIALWDLNKQQAIYLTPELVAKVRSRYGK
jgi:hypothetical protein